VITLKSILQEGMYDRITGIVIKDVFKELNNAYTKSGTQDNPKKYKGTVVRTNDEIDDVQYYFIKRDSFIDLGTYNDSVSGLYFSAEIGIIFSPSIPKGKPMIEGFASGDDEAIEIHIALNPEDGKSSFSKVQAILRDVVRHEIEHLTQSGFNQLPGKKRNKNFKMRSKIADDPASQYKYATLANEIEPMLHGLYSKAKTLKQPFQKVVEDFLDELVELGRIRETDKKLIYNKWKKELPKIGGLPKLK
jgi:hypothetical protein